MVLITYTRERKSTEHSGLACKVFSDSGMKESPTHRTWKVVRKLLEIELFTTRPWSPCSRPWRHRIPKEWMSNGTLWPFCLRATIMGTCHPPKGGADMLNDELPFFFFLSIINTKAGPGLVRFLNDEWALRSLYPWHPIKERVAGFLCSHQTMVEFQWLLKRAQIFSGKIYSSGPFLTTQVCRKSFLKLRKWNFLHILLNFLIA